MFRGAHAPRVLAKASSPLRTFQMHDSLLLIMQQLFGEGRKVHAGRVRSPKLRVSNRVVRNSFFDAMKSRNVNTPYETA